MGNTSHKHQHQQVMQEFIGNGGIYDCDAKAQGARLLIRSMTPSSEDDVTAKEAKAWPTADVILGQRSRPKEVRLR